VSVIRQKGPGVTGGSGFRQQLTQPFNKVVAIFIVSKDVPTFNSPDDNVMQNTRSI